MMRRAPVRVPLLKITTTTTTTAQRLNSALCSADDSANSSILQGQHLTVIAVASIIYALRASRTVCRTRLRLPRRGLRSVAAAPSAGLTPRSLEASTFARHDRFVSPEPPRHRKPTMPSLR
ncbi:hypothetical protein G7046_g5040 [Stylonectria norvegica]|nr:hypothetical protein G7046_g5040 [Stylonectria norvegica]